MSGIKTLLTKIDERVKSTPVNSRAVAQLVAGFESLDSVAGATAKSELDTLVMQIESAITEAEDELAVGKESLDLTEPQKELIKKAVAVAIDPVGVGRSIVKSMKDPDVVGYEKIDLSQDLTHFDIDTLSMDDVVKAFEAFDSQNVTANTAYSVVFTALSARQDEGAELFFPTIPIDANMSGATVTTTITSVIKDFLRNTDGTRDYKKFNKVPLVKIANKPDEIDVDKNKIVPVNRTEAAAYFVTDLAKTVDVDGEQVPTAPLVIGKEINILGLSQTDAMMAKGLMDPTDALDATVNIENLYVTLTGDDGNGGTITEYFKLDVTSIGAGFTHTLTGHNKDLMLNAELKPIGMNLGANQPTADGQISTLLNVDGAEGWSVRLRVKLHGDGNTQEGYIAVYANEAELIGVYNAAGEEVTSGTTYDSIVALFNTLKVVGYDVEAYVTNSNMRLRGLILTTDRYAAYFKVPFRTNYTIMLPVVSNGDDGDAQLLADNASVGIFKLNMAAYKTLDKFLKYMENSPDDATIKGVSNFFVDKGYVKDTIDIAQVVDSINSHTRIEDVRSALLLKIRIAATKIYLDTNYGIALNSLMPGTKPTVIVVTDPVIGMFLTGEEGGTTSDGIFNYIIKTTVNPYIRGKIVASFGVFDGNRNKEPNPLNFGQLFIAPSLAIPATRTVNNATRVETTVMSRFLHVVNLPIAIEYNVINVEQAASKLAVNMHTV